jgi:hypothetical protein
VSINIALHIVQEQHNAQKLDYLLLSSQDCIAAIDGTHVASKVLKSQSVA